MIKELKKLIKLILSEYKEDDKPKRDVLGEPDLTNHDQRQTSLKKKDKNKKDKLEMSAGGVAGVAVPLGRGPNYPDKIVKKSKKKKRK
tara:strand:- start:81 stop:344 length:264 start_codon:yes stop_codon:yes gene_type:complete